MPNDVDGSASTAEADPAGMKILIPIDGSVFTRRMLDYVVANARWLARRPHYTVLHCGTPLPHPAAAFQTVSTVRGFYDEDAESILSPVREFFKQHAIEADYVHRLGLAGALVSDFASRGRFDLLIMGSHGQGALRNLVLGSVTSHVLSSCQTPVLIVR